MLEYLLKADVSKSKMPLNLHLKQDEIVMSFLLALTGAGEKHHPCTTVSLRSADWWKRASFGNAEKGRGSWWWIFGSASVTLRQSEWQGEDEGDGVPRALMLLQSAPGFGSVQGFPSPGCHPDQIILAGALIWWMLHLSFSLWEEYSHVYFLNESVLGLSIKKPIP